MEKTKPEPLSTRVRNSKQPIAISDKETIKLIHDLEVHQIELELQNKELEFAKKVIQDTAEKYSELSDFSPAGYFTLPKEGEMAEGLSGMAIHYEIPDDLIVYAANTMLQSIIRNFVSNALKFTHRGGHVPISAKSLPDISVEVPIKDSGIGIPTKIMTNLLIVNKIQDKKGRMERLVPGVALLYARI